MPVNFDLQHVIAILLVFATGSYVWHRLCSRHGLPASLPWAGVGRAGPVGRTLASLRSLFGLKELIEDGYEKYSKAGMAFVLPNIITGPEVILPMSQIEWLLSQSDNDLSQREVNVEFLHAGRTMLHPHVSRDMVHGRVIRREMTKDLNTYCEDIANEIDNALTTTWGIDTTEWNEVPLYDTMLDVISRISNRVLVGKQLCRDPGYLRHSRSFARNVVITAGLLNLLPSFLQPIFAPLILAIDYHHYRKITQFVAPILKARAASFKQAPAYGNPDYSEYNDYLQWALHDALSHDDPEEKTTSMITKRLAVLSFAAIQSSVITITNCLFDVISSSACNVIQSTLHDEVNQVTGAHTGHEWSRASLAQMRQLDSALRESMRLWGFIARGVMKMVVKPQGIMLPSGQHLPHGSKVGVTSYAIHHDAAEYPRPFDFDAFRFTHGAGTFKNSEGDSGPVDVKQAAQRSMVTSGDNFMAFSHGRHACPGRFFAANQLKLLLAAIVTNYELEAIPERPVNKWLNNSIAPPMWAKVRVRRRPGTALSEVS